MYTLYNIRRWGSLAPHLVLEELDVPYRNIWMTPEQVRDPAFRKLSPLGLIPALGLDSGESVFESAAIINFLAHTHSVFGLAPAYDTAEGGAYLSWITFMSSNMYWALNLTFHPELYADDESHRPALRAKAVERSNAMFDVIEAKLEDEGPWLLGNDFSAADLYLFMMAVWAKPSEAALHERCPSIGALCSRVRQRPRLAAVLEDHGVVEATS